MDADKFIEQNQPLSKVRSKLSKYRSEILNMKKLGYSHEQIRVFLKSNEITVRVQSISKYFIVNSKSRSDPIIQPTVDATLQPKTEIPTPKINEPVKIPGIQNIPSRSNSPANLNRIMSAPVDLNAILRAAKKLEDAEKLATQNKI